MAPPVFAYFKSHHRRQGSNSDSPVSPQWNTPTSPLTVESNPSPSSFKPPAAQSPNTESSISSLPPILPPIPRVASKHESTQRSYTSPQLASRSPPQQKHSDPKTSTRPFSPSVPRTATTRQQEQQPLRIRTTDTKPTTGYRRKIQPQFQVEVDEYESPRPRSNKDRTPPEELVSPRRTHTNQPSPASKDFALRPITPSNIQQNNELYPPPGTAARRTSSPSSSLYSFQKSGSSSNMALDSSPGSSRSAQPPPAQLTSTNSKMGKPKMNLLNAVSLLKRRRTSQINEIVPDNAPLAHAGMDVPVMSLPQDYDPRIRGKGIHDFSKPKPERHHSANEIEAYNQDEDAGSSAEEAKRSSILSLPLGKATENGGVMSKASERQHTPVFVENFDEDGEDSGRSAVGRESRANQSFLARMSKHLDFNAFDFSSYDQNHLQNRESQQQANNEGERTSKSTVGTPSVRLSSEQSTARSSISNDTKATSPPGTPGKQTRTSASLEPPFQPEGLPKHLSSNASKTSRFSFQLNSDQTIEQEKALEEKGKQKAAAAKPESVAESREEEMDEDYEDDLLDMDDDMEEDVPLVGGVDDDAEDPASVGQPFLPTDDSDVPLQHESSLQMEGNNTLQRQQPQPSFFQASPQPPRQQTKASLKSEDMYFDDGLIDDPAPDAAQGHDDSYFDSPVESRKGVQSLNGTIFSISEDTWQPTERENVTIAGNQEAYQNLSPQLPTQGFEQSFGQSFGESFSQTQEKPLTQGNLDAYHDALAMAASRAEADGKFRRKVSEDLSITDLDSGLVPGINYPPPKTDINSTQDWEQNFDFEYAELDDLEDDPMIAAANAEVLASEDADYYGREFGFYGASATGSEAYNGGFFGTVADELRRSGSGMNASREPNLTPITERSEFSTRNSFISLQGSAPNSAISRADATLPSPSLQELAATMGMEDNTDMSMSQLMKLRKEAFGGGGGGGGSIASSSSASLPGTSNLASHPSIVPTVEEEQELDDFPYYDYEDLDAHVDDTFSNFSQEIEHASISSAPGSPTLTMGYTRTSPSNDTTPRPQSIATMGNRASSIYSGPHTTSPTPNHTSLINNNHGNTVYSQLNSSARPTSSTFPMQSNDGASFYTNNMLPYPLQDPQPQTYSHPIPLQRYQDESFTIPTHSESPSQRSPRSSSPHTSPIPMPMPSGDMIKKFAIRPPASSESYATRRQTRESFNFSQQDMTRSGGPAPDPRRINGSSSKEESGVNKRESDSVAYVMEDSKWFLERRRRTSNGELVVVERRVVDGTI